MQPTTLLSHFILLYYIGFFVAHSLKYSCLACSLLFSFFFVLSISSRIVPANHMRWTCVPVHAGNHDIPNRFHTHTLHRQTACCADKYDAWCTARRRWCVPKLIPNACNSLSAARRATLGCRSTRRLMRREMQARFVCCNQKGKSWNGERNLTSHRAIDTHKLTVTCTILHGRRRRENWAANR